MAYTTIDDPSAFFQTVLYTGNGGTQAITNTGNSDLQPNWIWTKVRSEVGSHRLVDTVRGLAKSLGANGTDAEADETNYSAFDSDGFSLVNDSLNENTRTYVAWQWKAGTSFSNDASSTSVGSVDSAGSVSTDAGFSIINVVKNNTTAHTVAHGLGAVPQMIIGKSRTGSSYRWIVYHKDIGNTHALYLNENFVKTDSVTFWNDTTPTSSVFSLGTDNSWNGTSIFYCFAEKQGYSKFGSYTGNGNADGTFVYTGFRPAFVITKASSVGQSWQLYDNKRNTFNQSSKILFPNLSASEQDDSSAAVIDILSNGFKQRVNDAGGNGSGETYIYMAFAENPFVTSTGIPTTAR